MRRPRKAAVRIVMAVALASAYLAASGAASMHLVLRDHAICLEHGELVHAEHADHAGAAVEGVPSTGHDCDAGPAFAAAPPVHQHEHCSLASHLPGNAEEPARAPALSDMSPSAGGRLLSLADGAPLGRAVTSLAPKHSPPAA